MNKWEKEVFESLLDSEATAIGELEKQYKNALNEINQKVKLFQADIDMLDAALNQDGLDESAKALLLSQKKSKIYQQQFQQALKDQVSGILDRMQGRNYSTIEGYLKSSYEDSYVGTLYDLAQQGITVMTPINQASAMQSILLDSKVSEGYYARLGADINKLKKTISQEISRGIASSLSYSDIARNIDNVSKVGLSNAKRIARTEGHRIQNTAARDAALDARNHGADLVKVWDSTLDSKTRPSHRMVDGEIRELDEKFSNGLDRPGDPNGSAEEVINCRCAEVHKPRWDAEGGFAKVDNETGEILTFNSPKDYADFKEKYWSKENQQYMDFTSKMETKYGTTDYSKILDQMSDSEYQKLKALEDASPMLKHSSGNLKSDSLSEEYFRRAEEELNRMTPTKSVAKWDSVLGVDSKTSEVLNEVHSDLNKHMIQTHTEKAVLIGVDGEVLYELNGVNINTTTPDDHFRTILKKSPASSIILSHVHPSSGSFSKEDIEHLILNKSIKALILEMPNGSKYVLDRGNFKTNIFSFGKYEKAFNEAEKEAHSLFKIFENDMSQDLPEELREEFISIWDDYENKRNEILSEKLGMKYELVKNNG